jgi:opacity protein-like surface antigen
MRASGKCVPCKLCLTFCILSLTILMLPHTTRGQGLELNGGWAHVTGNFGTDGFNVGAAWFFTPKVSLAADYDDTWDSTTLSTFAFTQVGAIAVHSHLQNLLFGPRIFFSTGWTDKHKLIPFGEAQFGFSDLNQRVQQVNMPTVSASDKEFAWMLGGGVDYLFTPHWSGRANLDFLRTHFASEGQSHLRFVLGITYTFGSRQEKNTQGH